MAKFLLALVAALLVAGCMTEKTDAPPPEGAANTAGAAE